MQAHAAPLSRPNRPLRDSTRGNYTLAEVADKMNVKPVTIKRRVERKTFPEPLPHGQGEQWRFRAREVEPLFMLADAKVVAKVLNRPDPDETEQPAVIADDRK